MLELAATRVFAWSLTVVFDWALLLKNAKVYVVCPSREKGENALLRLREETGKEGSFPQLDLASFTSIQEAAKHFLR